MSDIGPPYVGRSLLRREDRRLLRGQGQFIADLVLPRMLHSVLVRSPVAHACIRSAGVGWTQSAVLLPECRGLIVRLLVSFFDKRDPDLAKKWRITSALRFLLVGYIFSAMRRR